MQKNKLENLGWGGKEIFDENLWKKGEMEEVLIKNLFGKKE